MTELELMLQRQKEAEARINQLRTKGFDNNQIQDQIDFEEKQVKSYISLLGSSAHTYGNALAFMQNWIINQFPNNLFKTVHVNSKIAHRQLKETSKEFIKKSKPMIIFRPRIAGPDEDRFLKGTRMIERLDDNYDPFGACYRPFFEDINKDLMIQFQMNRSVMYVDVVLIFATLSQQIDYKSYIINMFKLGHNQEVHTYLESYLPGELIALTSEISGIPVYDSNGCTKKFLNYMSSNSRYPITYKLQGSTGKNEFFRYYPVNMDVIVNDLDSDDGEKIGHIMNQYQLNFTVRMEFESTGFYYIMNRHINDMELPHFEPSDSSVIPVFTDVYNEDDLHLGPGWHIYNAVSCMLDKPRDMIDLKQMFSDQSIIQAIKYYVDRGLPLTEFMDVIVRKQGELQIPTKDYMVDLENLILHFNNSNTFFTYRIIIAVNIDFVNDLIKQIYNLK